MGTIERSGEGRSDEGTAELEAGHLLADRYRIEGKLGSGGIGQVYRAVQLPLERPVAVKILHDDLLSMSELRARFEREARVLSALTHPHVVSISDYGIDRDRPFLVMELLEGATLEQVLLEGAMDPERALAIARQVLIGLAFAHQKGIAHRDLKPANVVLSRMPDGTEHAKLLDFGLARMVQPDGVADDQPTLTRRGVVFGTPAYMSPEQATGAPADERSDVYSAAVLLFELLAGRRPFVGETRAELLRAHLTAPVPRLRAIRPELYAAPALEALIDRAMAKDAEDRHRDAAEMLASLDAIVPPAAWIGTASDASTGGATRARWLMWIAAAAALALGALALVSSSWWVRSPASEVRVSSGPERDTAGDELHQEPGRPAPRDPWATPPPEPLRPFLRMVEDGHVFHERVEIRPLYLLAREMEGDPRPRLLMGHLFFLRGWLSEGIRRYEIAAQTDPSARGDRRMLANLVAAASRESVAARAADAIEAIYGAEAIPAIQAEVEALEGQALPQLRLVTLRDRLAPRP